LTFTVAQGMKSLTDNDYKWGEYYARRTIALAGDDSRVLIQGAAGLLHLSNDAEVALAAAESAYALNPNDWQVAAMSATVHLLCGDIDKAVARYSVAVRHGAAGVAARYARTGLAHAMVIFGEHEKAIEWANLSMTVSNSFPATYWMLVAANAHLERKEAAKTWLDALMSKWPNVTVASIRAGQPKFKPERIEPILKGLVLAGMAES
jgi:lipopolysaccharide biosynthesis regulator YciM